MALLSVIILSSIAFISGSIGGYIPLTKKNWSEDTLRGFIGFAAGLMISVALLHMVPEVASKNVFFIVLFGFFFLYLLERFMMVHSCPETGCEIHEIGKLAFLGLSSHSLFDGIGMGTSFILSEPLGIMVGFAILMHKLPTGFSLSSIMLTGKYSKNEIIWFVFIFSLMTPVGAIFSNILFKEITKDLLDMMIAFIAGTFLYLGASDLLPQTHEERSPKIILFVIFGALIGILTSFLF